MFYVYGYFEPDSLIPFYIGKGSGNRKLQHFTVKNLCRRTSFYDKLRGMLLLGLIPDIIIVKNYLTERSAFDLEIALIKFYGRKDNNSGCLCNHTDGGEGAEYNFTSARICHPVESFDPITGETMKKYPSIRSVSLDGYTHEAVGRIVKKKRCKDKIGNYYIQKLHNGLGWRYC